MSDTDKKPSTEGVPAPIKTTPSQGDQIVIGIAVVSLVAIVVVVGMALVMMPSPQQPNAGTLNEATDPTPPPARKVTSFLGMSFARVDEPGACTITPFADEYRWRTIVCQRGQTDDQMFFEQYLLDDAFPADRGRLLKAYSILTNTLTQSAAALDGYFNAFDEKYGPLHQGGRGREADVLLCDDRQMECRKGFVVYDPEKRYESAAMVFMKSIYKGDRVFHEVAVYDTDLLAKMSAAGAKADINRGRSAVLDADVHVNPPAAVPAGSAGPAASKTKRRVKKPGADEDESFVDGFAN